MDMDEKKKIVETCFGTSCNFCEKNCPIYIETKNKTLTARGRNRTILGLNNDKLKTTKKMAEAYAQCTGCGACERWCALPNTKLMVELRKQLVDDGFVNERHKRTKEWVEKFGTAYGEKGLLNEEWYLGLEFGGAGKPLFYTGCTNRALYPYMLRKSAEMLGTENIQIWEGQEICCGSPLYRTGYLEVYDELEDYIEMYLIRHEIKKIITTCAGCYSTLKNRFKGKEIEITHITEELANRYKNGQLKIKKIDNKKIITYHDPCHLGRLGGIYDAPRKLVGALTDSFVEMKDNRVDSKCCGAGGGVRSSNKDLAHKLARERIRQAEDIDAKIIITSCPFCVMNLKEASKMEVAEIVDLLYDNWVRD